MDTWSGPTTLVYSDVLSAKVKRALANGTYEIKVTAEKRVDNQIGQTSDVGSYTLTLDSDLNLASPSPSSSSPTTELRPTWTWTHIPDATHYLIKLYEGLYDSNASDGSRTPGNLVEEAELQSTQNSWQPSQDLISSKQSGAGAGQSHDSGNYIIEVYAKNAKTTSDDIHNILINSELENTPTPTPIVDTPCIDPFII